MTERHQLPTRETPDTFLRRTRIGAAVALLLVAGAVTSDFLDSAFWADHTMITGIVASLLVIAISAAILNELVERRDRQRWAVLAQYVLLDLVRTARASWTGILALAGLTEREPSTSLSLQDGSSVVADRAALRDGVAAVIADPEQRQALQRAVATMAHHCNDVLGRWASVMLTATAYTEVLDHHVELYSRIAWVDGLLGHYEPIDDDRGRRRLSRSSPAVQLQRDFDDDSLCEMMVSIVVLAEQLDRTTLALAMQLVPLDWWESRTQESATAPSHG